MDIVQIKRSKPIPYTDLELTMKLLGNIKVNENDCWIWQRSCDGAGYGMIWLGDKNGKSHRVSFIMFGGVLGPEEQVLHECDTPACANPFHLYAGTQKKNMEDCKSRGRLGNRGRKPKSKNLQT